MLPASAHICNIWYFFVYMLYAGVLSFAYIFFTYGHKIILLCLLYAGQATTEWCYYGIYGSSSHSFCRRSKMNINFLYIYVWIESRTGNMKLFSIDHFSFIYGLDLFLFRLFCHRLCSVKCFYRAHSSYQYTRILLCIMTELWLYIVQKIHFGWLWEFCY